MLKWDYNYKGVFFMMRLNLRNLHLDILKHNITYDVFDYSHNGIQFNILFDVNCIPFKLIFIKKKSVQYLILDVMAGYCKWYYGSAEKFQHENVGINALFIFSIYNCTNLTREDKYNYEIRYRE